MTSCSVFLPIEAAGGHKPQQHSHSHATSHKLTFFHFTCLRFTLISNGFTSTPAASHGKEGYISCSVHRSAAYLAFNSMESLKRSGLSAEAAPFIMGSSAVQQSPGTAKQLSVSIEHDTVEKAIDRRKADLQASRLSPSTGELRATTSAWQEA